MRSFFSQRKNRIKLGSTGITSKWKDVKRGCPQGSAFGPLLWNMFQNDMPLQVKNPNLYPYANDHQLYAVNRLIQIDEKDLEGVEAISDWYKENLLKANHEKYQIMSIGPKEYSKDKITSLNIDEDQISIARYLKILGVNIDEIFNFNNHVTTVCRQSSQKVGVLLRLRKLIPESAKLQLYKSAIIPHLTYCHLVWYFCRASDKRKLKRIQERTLRAVFNTNSLTYQELLDKAQLLSLNNRRLQDITILVYKIKNNLTPQYINELFCNSSKRYRLRNADFDLPRYNTAKYRRHSIRYYVPYVLSKLNKEDRERTSLESFKKNIRKKDLESLLDNNCKNCVLCIT